MLNETPLEQVNRLPGFERGHPHYFKDPMIDHLLEIVMMLGGELWVTRDRQMVMEYLLETEGKVTAESIERFKPSAEFKAKLDQARTQFNKGIYGCLYAEHEEAGAETYFSRHSGKK
jgi:hypothetical protein